MGFYSAFPYKGLHMWNLFSPVVWITLVFFLVDERRGDTTKLRVRIILFSRNGRSFKVEDLPASHHLILALRMLFGVCGRKHGVLHPLLFHAFVAGVGGIFHIILPQKQSNSAGWHWMDLCCWTVNSTGSCFVSSIGYVCWYFADSWFLIKWLKIFIYLHDAGSARWLWTLAPWVQYFFL